ncbi:MAG TPA: hypothetical protein VMT94_01790 [Burkholderiales bacterium]|nr:hypothetical protein [Burkholderiales bacterium]
MRTANKYGFRLSLIVGIISAVFSTYFFIYGSYEDVVLALLLFGVAVAFETIGAVVSRERADLKDGEASPPPVSEGSHGRRSEDG